MTAPSGDSRPSLEQLLRMKRAERPPQEFWVRFEQELRAKQLAAIVEKRPWWSPLSPFASALRRSRLPLGAAAAVTAAWVGLHQLSYDVSRPPVSEAAVPAEPADAVATVPSGSPATVVAAMPAETRPEPAAAVAETVPLSRPAVVVSADGAALQAPAVVPAQADAIASGSFEREAAIAPVRMLGAALASPAPAVAAAAGRDLLSGLTPAPSYQPRLVASRSRLAEPLARMASPSEERRSRLLAETVPAASFSADSRPSERTVGGLSEDRLVESIQRYDVDAHSVSFKF